MRHVVRLTGSRQTYFAARDVIAALFHPIRSRYSRTLQQSESDLLQERGFNVGSKTPQHRFSTPFSAALQNKLQIFVTRFTVP